jgi:hypothetical protein
MSLGTRYTPQQKEEMANTALTGQMATKSAAEVTDRQNLYDQIKRMNPGISDKLATEYALKIPASMINPPQSTVNNVAGSDITLEKDSAGMPIDKKPGMLYSVRLNQAGEMVSATPTLNPQGTMRWAQDENQHWIGFTTNKSGQVTRHTDIGLTPPQGVPLDSIEHGFKLAGQADGSTVLVPVTTVTERGRGIGGSTGAPSPSTGVPVPTAPPAPGEAPVAKPASPQASVNPGGAVRVGAKSLNPEQVMKASQNAEAYMRTVGRMASVLDRFGKVDMSSVIKRAQMKIASNPDGTMKLVVADNSKLTPDESSLAADYASLGEDVQLLRAVDQATGFRGQQAFEALLGQRGNMLGNPDVFKKVLKNSMESLVQQLRPMVKTLNESGQPVGEVPDGVIRAYQIIANGDFAKAKAAMKRDGWVK